MKRILAAAIAMSIAPAMAEDLRILGPNAAACAPGASGPAVLVVTTGFKDRIGNLRVELYPAVEGEFLAFGSKLRADGKVYERIDIPTPQTGDAAVCVVLPAEGSYTISVLHDRNANGRLDAFTDGYGFPNNPRLRFGPPSAAEATFTTAGPQTRLDVVLNYWTGLAARPVSHPK
jgi:uncharacterized protein (DUF2141 family)